LILATTLCLALALFGAAAPVAAGSVQLEENAEQEIICPPPISGPCEFVEAVCDDILGRCPVR
jgi:hypothetical protein